MKKYALALDLFDDAELIKEYELYHRNPWPEVTESIFSAGVISMEIYRTSNRLFMLIQTNDDFSFEIKRRMDESNLQVQLWEKLMWKFQKALPWSAPNEKWVLMSKIYDLHV